MECGRNTREIFKRELKSYFESPVAYVFLVTFLVLIGFLTFFMERYFDRGQADLRPFFNWHPWVYLFLVPAASMRLWSEERRTGTIELLLTLPVTPAQAILGKFLAAWAFLGLALVLTFPILPTTAWILHGDVDSGVVLGGYLGSFLLAGAYLSVGIATSAMTRNQVISFVASLAICFVLLLAGYPPFTDMFVRWAPNWLVQGVAAFSVMPHYESLQSGVLELRDIVFYISLMAVMLFATHLILKNRRA